uniref:Uncharacterized protein n=4 Tax=gambiae species complex TaxID=44542 RepID=A0A1S4H291_ANOGA
MTSPKISADKTTDSNAATPKHQGQQGQSNEASADPPADGAAGGGAAVQAVVAATVQSIRERGFYGCFSWLKVFRFANLMIKQGC